MGMFRRFFQQTGDDSDDQETVPHDEQGTSRDEASARAQDERLDENEDDITVPVGEDESPTLPDRPGGQVADGATRQLPLETVIASRNAHLQFGQSTDVGMVRSNNQDAMLTFYYSSRSTDNSPDFGLFIVADGMGGHHDGEKAAAIVTRKVAKQVVTNIFAPMMLGDDDMADRPPLTESLTEAIQSANADVLSGVPDGGTTVTAVAVVGDLAYFAHVGDSRAYLITKEGMEQVTRDHSLVQRLIELDQLTPEEAKGHPNENVLYRAIGQSDSLEVDALTRRLPANSYLLLCSDGLWGVVEDEMILEIIRANPTPQTACDKLVAMANSMGGKDNITAVMLHVPS
jgi:PPM family protein phosphatase